jgi:hypothetical protein
VIPTTKSAEHTVPVAGFSPKLISFDVFGTLISVRESLSGEPLSTVNCLTFDPTPMRQ